MRGAAQRADSAKMRMLYRAVRHQGLVPYRSGACCVMGCRLTGFSGIYGAGLTPDPPVKSAKRRSHVVS